MHPRNTSFTPQPEILNPSKSTLLQLPTFSIDSQLPPLLHALETDNSAIVTSPPGSGKTTRIPLALLDASWRNNKKILLLEPRRVAARSAARYMAKIYGEPVGKTIGFRTRVATQISNATQIEVITEGVLLQMLQNDPELSSVACILFDEFHERTLHADLGLALALDIQKNLRPDLRLVILSATVDSKALSGFLNNAAIIESSGKQFEVTIRYLPPAKKFVPYETLPILTFKHHILTVINHSLKTETGSILVFLPGMKEINLIFTELHQQLHNSQQLQNDTSVEIHILHGSVLPELQDKAIVPCAAGKRKIILATSVGETSVTIEGIRIVIDSGLSRVKRYNQQTELGYLTTQRACLATIQQRTGRAGRTEAGICFRLWDKQEEVTFSPYTQPEIVQADLTALVLQTSLWGVTHYSQLQWLTPPKDTQWQKAMASLQEMECIDIKGAITSYGKQMAGLPVHPRLAHLLLQATITTIDNANIDNAHTIDTNTSTLYKKAHLACFMASYLTEVYAPPTSNFQECLEQVLNEPYKALHSTIITTTQKLVKILNIPFNSNELTLIEQDMQTCGILLAKAWPRTIAQKIAENKYKTAKGQQALLPASSAQSFLGKEEYLIILHNDGTASKNTIRLAIPFAKSNFHALFSHTINKTRVASWNMQKNAFTVQLEERFYELVLTVAPSQTFTVEEKIEALLYFVKNNGLSCFEWTSECVALQNRLALLHQLFPDVTTPNISEEHLLATLETWLLPHLAHVNILQDFKKLPLQTILQGLIPYTVLHTLDIQLPEQWLAPSGRTVAIDYSSIQPHIAIKLQETFGLQANPTIAGGRMVLPLHLLSPAKHPLHITSDILNFWKTTYTEVKKEMRGRYPKHPWPDDALTAIPTAFTKKRMQNATDTIDSINNTMK